MEKKKRDKFSERMKGKKKKKKKKVDMAGLCQIFRDIKRHQAQNMWNYAALNYDR